MQATYGSGAERYPARLEGRLEQPSRWLWLVKWLLLVPHYVALVFLWLAFLLLSVAAFFVLLFGGSYPAGIFDFNIGVLRWTWRVSFYAFNANGTDRYPPFTLADVPDYPARLEIEYPQNQRHGLPLIGWWLIGIPQYIVAGVFAGGGSWASWNTGRAWAWTIGWGGLIGLLVFVSVVVLLVRGEYPRSIFDFVLGMNRWVLRVGAYAALMTREYPPFRFDAGERDPGGLTLAAPDAGLAATMPIVPAAPARAQRWGPGRVIAVIFASIGVLLALALVAAGGTALVYDQTQRDSAGYLMTDYSTYSTATYAIVSDSYRTGGEQDWRVGRDLLGHVRVRTLSSVPLFVGIGRATEVDRYLAGVNREVAKGFDASSSGFKVYPGRAPAGPPTAQHIWVAKTVGSGSQELVWSPPSGDWRIVLMRPDAARGVRTELAIGAEFPHLLWIGIGVAAGGGLLLLLCSTGLLAAVRRRT